MTGPHADYRLRRTLLLFVLLIAACSDRSAPAGPAGPQPPQAGPAVRIEIAPSSVLLTEPGATRQLVAVGYDADGNETEVDVTWSTSDAAVAAIAADGTLTAQADAGSAQVVARAGTLAAAPVLVLVAQPVAGAVLVEDEQLVSGPVAVSPDDEYGVGWRYAVRLRGMSAPATGTVLLAAGGARIAGRVVETAQAGTDIDVTLELMPLPEMFERLVINEAIPLNADDAQLDASLVRDYSLGRGLAGEIVLTPRTAGSWKAAPTAAAGEFELGPFTCETDGSIPEIDLPKPEIDVDDTLVLEVVWEDVLERLAVVGDIDASFSFRPVLEVVFEGEIDCSATPVTVPFPITGVASWALSGLVPLGVGMKLEGKATLAEVGFDVSASAGARATLGVACPGGGACSLLTSFEKKPFDYAFELVAPDEPLDEARLELGATGYVLAKLAFGSMLLSEDLELLEGKAGVKQGVDLMLAHAQVADEDYASGFDLTAEITLGPGEHLQTALDKVGGMLGVDIDATVDLAEDLDPLAESPKGTLTIEPATVTAGDTTDVATFTLELDPVTYLGLQSVDSVQFFWKKPDDAGGFTLEPGMPDCNVIAASSGQKTFECETAFLEEHIGEQSFAAFVYARLFDVPIPVPLELAMDTVQVQPNVECGVPGEWDLWGVFDDSEVEAGASLTTNLDYLAVSGEATTTSTGGDWSPDAYMDAKVVDYIRVIPLVADDSYSSPLYAITRGTGRVTAVVSENNCCGTYGDGRAEIEISSSWLEYSHRLSAAAGASWSGDLGPTDEQQLDVESRAWLGNPWDDRWQNMEMDIWGTVRHRGSDNSATVTGELTITVLDVVDGNDVPVPVVICSAAGYNYGTFAGAAGPVVASRPVRQSAAGMR